MKYHIWTAGCQMNVADSQRVASSLEQLGYGATDQAEEADVIVLNTCVVRQSAEDRAYGRLSSLRPLKDENPDLVINLMGCLVGVKDNPKLRARFPYVDVFSPPSDPEPLIEHLAEKQGRRLEREQTRLVHSLMDEDLILPAEARGQQVAAYVPIVYGCSHACTFCIIPYRRGAERSRSIGQIGAEVRQLADQGVREVTLLGQIVDRYGLDVEDGPTLAELLQVLHQIDGIDRLRFLTSHPNWMTDELLDTVARLPKVCEHIEVPVQAGDDEVLRRMKRGYGADDYRRLIDRIRNKIPGVSIGTDIIVGFPGETSQQFQATYDLLAELKLDVVHLARYSPRPNTVAERRMPDDVSEEEKMRRFRAIEELQEGISQNIHQELVNRQVEVLVEEKHRGSWKGRTRTNKLVFFDDPADWRGKIAQVKIHHAGAWSLNGQVVHPVSSTVASAA